MTLPDMITKIRTFWFGLTGMSRWTIVIIFVIIIIGLM